MIRLGQRLEKARKKQHISIEDASKTLKIRPEFLEALEKGEYHKLPPSTYAHGFVSTYAHFLGLPGKETLAMFRREFDEKKAYTVLPQSFTRSSEFSVKRRRTQQALLLFSAFFLGLVAFLLFQYRYAFIDPPLEVIIPKENDVVISEVQVKGTTDPHASVLVNNSFVSVDESGFFTKRLDMFEGKTIIRVTAQNKFGRKSTIDRHIEVKKLQ